MSLSIEVGQQWKTRAGDVVRVTADRAQLHQGWPGVDVWRWAISNGQLANTDGRIDYEGRDDPRDLIELLGGQP